MAQQTINIGAVANDRTGDTWRDAMDKANDNFTELFDIGTPEGQVIVNSLADFPTPLGQVITLLAETKYLIGSDVSIGDNRLVLASNTSVSGIESINVTLTYTGTGDMFTIINTRNRISSLSISCSAGRVLNFSDNTDSIFRMNDCSVACATFGLFNSNGTNGSTTRFTNVSPSSMTADGLSITGNWNTWLWEVSAVNVTAGELFDFGVATFNEIILDLILASLGAGTFLIKGAAGSANINTGGSAFISRMLTSGDGTPLSGVAPTDALWEFAHNDDIADTRPDGLLSMQSNAVATVVAAAGTPVLVAGTWVVERTSQFTGTTAGRLTYIGGKNITLPITGDLTVEPVSGGAVDISVEVSINGNVVPNSKRTTNASSGNKASLGIPWQDLLSTNDFIEFFVTNESTGVDILVSSAISRIN